MKRLLLLLTLAAACMPLWGQRTQGYWFVAPGGATNGRTQTTMHLGGGAEINVWRNIALGLEGGALGLTEEWTHNVRAVASLNGTYSFRPDGVRLDPFATAGYSIAFGRGTDHMPNYGGGLNYWFSQELALRFEFRDHVLKRPVNNIHLWGFRFGLSFTQLD
jgi:hypothetical protein